MVKKNPAREPGVDIKIFNIQGDKTQSLADLILRQRLFLLVQK